LRGIDSFADVRMIRLQALRKDINEKGGWIGLKDPRYVINGLVSFNDVNNKCIKVNTSSKKGKEGKLGNRRTSKGNKQISDDATVDVSGSESSASSSYEIKQLQNYKSVEHEGDSTEDPQQECFTVKLMKLLNQVSEQDPCPCVGWHQDGQWFVVYNQSDFEKTILAKHFNINYSSFHRYMNDWGFRMHGGGYFHELFRRDKPENCEKIEKKISSLRTRNGVGGSGCSAKRSREETTLSWTCDMTTENCTESKRPKSIEHQGKFFEVCVIAIQVHRQLICFIPLTFQSNCTHFYVHLALG